MGCEIDVQEMVKKMLENWGSQFVARSHVGTFTGGAITAGTQANIDSMGQGPERFQIGKKTIYRTETYASWFVKRIKAAEKRGKVGASC